MNVRDYMHMCIEFRRDDYLVSTMFAFFATFFVHCDSKEFVDKVGADTVREIYNNICEALDDEFDEEAFRQLLLREEHNDN